MESIKQILEHFINLFKWFTIILSWEQGVRVRLGKKTKLLSPGIYFKIPVFDSVFIQTTRMRMISLPIQTLTSSDGKTITIMAAVGYTIDDMLKLYQTLYHPENTISNLTMSEISKYIYSNEAENCSPTLIERHLNDNVKFVDNGISPVTFKILDFALVKTFRLIQDKHWTQTDLKCEAEK